MVVRLTSDIDAAEDFISSAVLGIVLDLLTLVGMMARDVLSGLALQPDRPVGGAGAVRDGVSLHAPHQEGGARRSRRRRASWPRSSRSRSPRCASSRRSRRRTSKRSGSISRARRASTLSLRARSIKARLPPLVDIIVAVGTCLVLWFGVRLVLADRLTAGALLVFVLYLGKMYKPMKDLSKMTRHAVEGGGRLRAHRRDPGDREPGARSARRAAGAAVPGRIEFAHVRFGYAADQPVLKDVEPRRRARPARRAGRPDRQRQVDADRPDSAALRHARRAASPSTATTSAATRWNRCAGRSASCCRRRCCSARRSRRTSPTASPARRARRSCARPSWPTPTSSSRGCRRATTR